MAGGANDAAQVEAPPERSGGEALRRICLLGLCGAALYLVIEAIEAMWRLPVPDSIHVGVPFLLLPALYYWRKGTALAWGPLDRTWVFSAACYAPFAVWVIAFEPGAPGYFLPLARNVAAFPGVLWWSLDTFFHVGSVDFFTKRVVQSEAALAWGGRRAILLQWAAWCAGHIVEWMWLRYILGDVGAAVFLAAAGLVTGLAYARWKNVGGLMAGHFLVNVAAAGAAAALFL